MDLREKMARKIAKEDGYDDYEWKGASSGFHNWYLRRADAALSVLRAEAGDVGARAGRLAKDCRDAAQALAKTGTFPTGQSILLEAADALEAQAAELAQVRGERDRLRVALADLTSWFDDGPSRYGPWIIKAGDPGADAAVEFARATLAPAAADESGEAA
ncbi:hypothetical protein [Albimonas pacifica]|uniref:Uncharacterized protein n=1 Tax=Albimonas pacifica TaxID=1114924 RepID=A0A1I3FW82_9RHOB|nr:hypothetical protein [Albimonas pacifica]SFI15171.1 hypothetical protein SAMN05216258_104542 [Albimonas pacifica]